MGRYTVIADISEKIVSLLCDGMVPDLIPDKNGIGLCGPDEMCIRDRRICVSQSHSNAYTFS